MTDQHTPIEPTDRIHIIVEPDGFTWSPVDERDVPVVDEATRDRIWARIVAEIRESPDPSPSPGRSRVTRRVCSPSGVRRT